MRPQDELGSVCIWKNNFIFPNSTIKSFALNFQQYENKKTGKCRTFTKYMKYISSSRFSMENTKINLAIKLCSFVSSRTVEQVSCCGQCLELNSCCKPLHSRNLDFHTTCHDGHSSCLVINK